ncbi:MAG: dienelactone hydrolase family protein [Candidatus Thorarchaeota archaeon]
MQVGRPRFRYIFLIISIVMMLSGVALAGSTQNGVGTVTVTEVDYQATDGSNIHATLQQPVYATSSDPLPGVIIYHGSLQNKEWLMAFGIELARRGFVVLTPDANGHGNSDDGSGSGSASLEFLASLEYVDTSAIGLVGHSMGGGTAWQAMSDTSIDVKAVVLVGSWIRSDWNATYPSNLLVTVGDFDSLFSGRDVTMLDDIFNTTSVADGVLYGDFDSGTARKYVLAKTNHLFETIDPEIVSETVEWMKDSLKGGVEDAHWIPSSNLVYSWWLVGGFLATLGAVLTIFPLITILLDTSLFVSLKKKVSQDDQTEEIQTKGPFTKWGLIYSIVPPLTFFPLLLVGTFIPFPQSYGGAISLWFLGTGLILFLLLRIAIKGKMTFSFSKDTSLLLRTFALALIVILWLYGWTLLVDLGFALDFRCFLPGMNDLTFARALFVPIYAVVFFIYFLVDSMWLMGPLRPHDVEPWYKGLTIWSIKSVLIKCYPFAILIGYEYGLGFLLGFPVVPGMIGYSFLFFYAFAPWFAVSAVISVYCYRSTNKYYLGPFLKALLFAWMLATILAF